VEDVPDRWVADQIVYYRRRAEEYDATAFPPGDPLHEHKGVLREALREFAPRGRVLEIACGTGMFTHDLVPFADEITALDSSPEMLEQHRRNVPSTKVRRIQTDVFSWKPDAAYDVVFFSFWLSHVPTTHFERFWDVVRKSLATFGRVFVIDEGRHSEWEEQYVDEAAGVVRRRLLDGSEHRAIKILWDPPELERKLREIGWDMTVRSTGLFYWGFGRSSRSTE
jgi:demethylmenaquinone methyltransferase/2-methoxy-6-polyprenyl-1,4-benzoquinol methylase